ncbi:MAG: WD40 repeat domain-containing protein, partial [Flavobacteriales bacterium]
IYRIVQHGDLLVSCSRDKTIKCWDLLTLAPLARIEASAEGHRHSVNEVISSKNSIISAGDDRQIICWKWG